MERGLVKWFNDEKGYGFITVPGKKDFFVHFSSIEQEGRGRRNLTEGQEVEFEIAEGQKGPVATKVRKV